MDQKRTEIKKTPPKVKRKPVKIRRTRRAVKVKDRSTPFQQEFGSLLPPGKYDLEGLRSLNIDPAKINAEQLQALRQESFLLWACTSGIEIDHKPFDIDNHKYLIPMYADRAQEFVLMKSAQMGATILVLLKIFWFGLYKPVKCCFYFPTDIGVNLLSKDRLTPIVASNRELYEAVQDTDTLGYKTIGNKSAVYLRSLGGVAAADSTPFDLIAFDEVRLLDPAEIDRARERISHSTYKYVMQVSTAGLPNSDIHRQFLMGNQQFWHSNCNCFPLSQEIIARRKGTLVPETVSLKTLQSDWRWYEALSWNVHHKIWQYKAITKFHYNGTRNVIKIRFRNGASLIVTSDHKFYQHKGGKNGRTTSIAIGEIPLAITKNDREKKISRVLVARQIPEPGTHNGYQKGRVFILQTPWDNLTLYAVGAYVAEGSRKADLNITFSSVEGKFLRKKVIIWAENNNLPICERHSGVDVSLASRPDLNWLFKNCGNGCENKQIPHDIMIGSNKQLEIVLNGYLDGDGSYNKHKIDNRGVTNNQEWSCVTTSYKLVKQLIFIGLRIGKPVHQTKDKKIEGKKQSWTLYYNPKSAFNTPLLGYETSKDMMSGVTLKEKNSAGRITVGCISVKDNSNFVLADSGLLVHNCGIDGVVLSDVWPDCVAVTKKEIYYRCPRCKTRIRDPQNGRFIPHNPGADVSSYHIHQMMSRYISPAQVWHAYQTTQNMKEFYNAKLGVPYVDSENVPVTMDDLVACENTDLQWGPVKSPGAQIGMGVDQMSGVNYVVIAERTPYKKRILHYEIIDSMNPIYAEAGKRVTPFKRLYQLMNEYRVGMCIIDAMPNANEAMEFARAFPKRVFVSWYLDSRGTSRDMVQWGDRARERQNVKRGGPKIKFKYSCILNRYLSIEFALAELANRQYEWPHPGNLVQVCRSLDSGHFEPVAIMEAYFYLHMTKIVRQKTPIDETTGRYKMEWVNLGIDPHSVHALNYCNIAIERLRKVPIVTFA